MNLLGSRSDKRPDAPIPKIKDEDEDRRGGFWIWFRSAARGKNLLGLKLGLATLAALVLGGFAAIGMMGGWISGPSSASRAIDLDPAAAAKLRAQRPDGSWGLHFARKSALDFIKGEEAAKPPEAASPAAASPQAESASASDLLGKLGLGDSPEGLGAGAKRLDGAEGLLRQGSSGSAGSSAAVAAGAGARGGPGAEAGGTPGAFGGTRDKAPAGSRKAPSTRIGSGTGRALTGRTGGKGSAAAPDALAKAAAGQGFRANAATTGPGYESSLKPDMPMTGAGAGTGTGVTPGGTTTGGTGAGGGSSGGGAGGGGMTGSMAGTAGTGNYGGTGGNADPCRGGWNTVTREATRNYAGQENATYKKLGDVSAGANQARGADAEKAAQGLSDGFDGQRTSGSSLAEAGCDPVVAPPDTTGAPDITNVVKCDDIPGGPGMIYDPEKKACVPTEIMTPWHQEVVDAKKMLEEARSKLLQAAAWFLLPGYGTYRGWKLAEEAHALGQKIRDLAQVVKQKGGEIQWEILDKAGEHVMRYATWVKWLGVTGVGAVFAFILGVIAYLHIQSDINLMKDNVEPERMKDNLPKPPRGQQWVPTGEANRPFELQPVEAFKPIINGVPTDVPKGFVAVPTDNPLSPWAFMPTDQYLAQGGDPSLPGGYGPGSRAYQIGTDADGNPVYYDPDKKANGSSSQSGSGQSGGNGSGAATTDNGDGTVAIGVGNRYGNTVQESQQQLGKDNVSGGW